MVLEEGSLIYSKADMQVKQKNKKNSRDQQSPAVSRVQKIEMNQCVNHKLQTKSKQWQCQGKSFQAKKCVHMQLKKPAKDMQLNEPAMLIQHKKLKKQIVLQKMTRTVNLKSIMDQKCVLTRNVKLPSITRKLTKTVKQVLLCGQ